MADLLEWGANWLEQQRTQHLTRTVTYRRGAESVDVAASIGRTEFEVDDGYGVRQTIESRDYLVLAANLVLSGMQTLPERGDRIEETSAATRFVYEVLAPGQEPAWRYSDPYRLTLRIHTKQIGSEPV
ncbi:hypothetical protein [Maioricimonas sp. JC845]|uniref:hypothetical protein n=1 Tax=Maioricimonas sp. JC845 TaxID=3232138 RepID=UPI00345AAE7A